MFDFFIEQDRIVQDAHGELCYKQMGDAPTDLSVDPCPSGTVEVAVKVAVEDCSESCFGGDWWEVLFRLNSLVSCSKSNKFLTIGVRGRSWVVP